MEGLILERTREKIESNISHSQFGFRPNMSTEDAIIQFLEYKEQIQEKYALGIFPDISGAFNNLWWPDIIEDLKRIECSIPILDTIRDYLKNRTVLFRTQNGEIIRHINKGCPQGSLLGPFL